MTDCTVRPQLYFGSIRCGTAQYILRVMKLVNLPAKINRKNRRMKNQEKQTIIKIRRENIENIFLSFSPSHRPSLPTVLC